MQRYINCRSHVCCDCFLIVPLLRVCVGVRVMSFLLADNYFFWVFKREVFYFIFFMFMSSMLHHPIVIVVISDVFSASADRKLFIY